MASSYYKKTYKNGKTILEHREVMEKAIGRRLTKDEHVHHLNRDPMDNRIENLKIVTNSEHASLHNSDHHARNSKIKMKRVNIYFKKEHIDYLESFPISIAEQVRRAVDEYIAKLNPLNASASESTRKEVE